MKSLVLIYLLFFTGISFAKGSLDLLLELDKGKHGNDEFGSCVSYAGDINNDGFDDIIVGVPYMGAAVGPSSYVYIYYGGTNMDTKVDVIIKETLFNFGKNVSCAGDINNDGYDDIMISNEENVYFYYGGSEMDTISDITLKFNYGFEYIQSISMAGDVNSDGDNDILISTSEPSSDSTRTGRVYIYSGIIKSTSINSNLTVTKSFLLHQNCPNPFNPLTTIKYDLPKPSTVTLKIYSLSGQEIETLVNSFQTPGEHEITWQPQGLPSGIYFYRLHAGVFLETKKLILQK